MARGKSGRIVIEVDPELKKKLYQVLEKKDLTLKSWFVNQAELYIRNHDQLQIFHEKDNTGTNN
ncbi:hypothetical protein SAMN05443144_1328 [Fodinibius roseus]|uniref:Uncharacterized protein n=1 Tax=Fodinibius roseus TaxID=1194090 RepID=A0A1M5KHJ3_9BACT|nr:hypothetical protein [Fodinibius roseus]SHG51949.1 hypothetical protein SAMN05443144_1328 [Fodinibius roseus]